MSNQIIASPYSDGTNGCRMEIHNLSPFSLYLDKSCTDHGIWDVVPPSSIAPFGLTAFRVKDVNSSVLHPYSGSEASATYIANNTVSTSFTFSCDVPYNGMITASLSNSNPSRFNTFFYCSERRVIMFDNLDTFNSTVQTNSSASSSGGLGQVPKSHFGYCNVESHDVDVRYHIRQINSREVAKDPFVSDKGSTYIKISNVTPYTLHLMSSSTELGFWEKELEKHVGPFSSTQYAHLFQDIATGEQSKGSAFYAFASGSDKLNGLRIGFYNPQNVAQDDECRSSTQAATGSCVGVDSNFVTVSNPDTTRFSTYYECSSDGETWVAGSCDKFSDLLYLNVYIAEI